MLRLSNSEMVTFRRCKRRWWLSYFRGLIPLAEHERGSAISIGNLVHDALAAYYDPEVRQDPVEHARGQVEAAIYVNPGYEIEITKEWDLVEAMLTGYMEWLEDEAADSDLIYLGSERRAEVAISDDVALISKLDAVVEQRSDGAKLALEHKTVGNFVDRPALAALDTQLLTEHLVRFMDAQEKGATSDEAYAECHGVLLNMLRKVKRTARATPPFYMRVVVPHNVEELRNHWRHVLSIAREIQSVTRRLEEGESHHSVVPPSPANDCCWSCEFFKVCKMWDDGSRIEDAISAMYRVGNPLERYDGSESL